MSESLTISVSERTIKLPCVLRSYACHSSARTSRHGRLRQQLRAARWTRRTSGSDWEKETSVYLQRRLQVVHLEHLHLELLVKPANPGPDALAQLTKRRLHLKLGLVPLPLLGGVHVNLDCSSKEIKVESHAQGGGRTRVQETARCETVNARMTAVLRLARLHARV